MKAWLFGMVGAMGVCLVAIALLSGCGAGRYYDDNPRNMQNMSASEIERELSQ